MSYVRTPAYLQYLLKEMETAAALILSLLLPILDIQITDIGVHPQLRLVTERDDRQYHIVRYAKNKWRVYEQKETVPDFFDAEGQEWWQSLFPNPHWDYQSLHEVMQHIYPNHLRPIGQRSLK